MILVSELAKTVLLESLQASGASPDQGLRLRVGASGFLLETDQPNEQDRVIQHEGANVVIVDPDIEVAIGDAIIDITDSPEGPELVFRRISRNGHHPEANESLMDEWLGSEENRPEDKED
jgi:Fe-S cluster assembly iron-binding protein IscA